MLAFLLTAAATGSFANARTWSAPSINDGGAAKMTLSWRIDREDELFELELEVRTISW
jgi:hypothetical protein